MVKIFHKTEPDIINEPLLKIFHQFKNRLCFSVIHIQEEVVLSYTIVITSPIFLSFDSQ